MKRALVLGGGGVLGVAWEEGLLAGLADGGVDVRDADVVVGSSAGSIVASGVLAGRDPREPSSRTGPGLSLLLPEGGLDGPLMLRTFAAWGDLGAPESERCQRVGACALEARTASEADWIASIDAAAALDDWPGRPFAITATDVRSGGRRVFRAGDGVPISLARAASCAIPSIFPTVAIGGERYMDGCIGSSTNGDLVLGDAPDVALLVGPLCAGSGGLAAVCERALQRELDALRAAGARTIGVVPGAAELRAMGANVMDPARVPASREAGRVRGLALARAEAGIWRE